MNALYEEEKSHLVALPEEVFSNVQTCDGRADKYATVIVDKNRYSVPSRCAGFRVKVLLHVDRVEIFTGAKKVATHERLYGNNKWCLNPDHYLDLIQQRPMAFRNARPIRQWQESWPQSLHVLLERFCSAQGETRGIKDFVTVLMLYRNHEATEVEAAVRIAAEKHISSSEGVRHILASAASPAAVIGPLSVTSLAWSTLSPPDVAVYGQLGGVQ